MLVEFTENHSPYNYLSFLQTPHLAKYAIMILLGSANKTYDDLIDLYLWNTNTHIVIFFQCLQIVLVCLWLFVFVENKFDVFVIIIMCGYCLIDWDAYVSDPYFAVTTFFFIILSILTILTRGWSFTTYELFIAYSVGLLLTTAVTEKFCIHSNGPYYRLMRWIYYKPESERFVNKYKISATTLEVSYYKVKVRVLSILYLLVLFCLIIYLLGRTEPHGMWYNLLFACSYFNIGFVFYYITSICNQLIVLNLYPEIVEKHKVKNNDDVPDVINVYDVVGITNK